MSGESEEAETETASEEAEAESDEQTEQIEEQTEQTEQTEQEEEEQPEEGLQAGDFVRIAYTARTVDEGLLVDTTDEEVAEEEDIAEDRTFEPRVVALGAGHLFEKVEEAIIGSEVGSSGSVVVPAPEAFGEYDQDEVRTVSANKIPEDDRYPGAQVQIDGQQGRLETIIGGRARVDYNHPLAGEDIEYEYEVLDVVEDDLERAKGLMGVFFDLDLDMHIQTDEVEEEQLVEPDEAEEEDEESEPEYETVTTEKETLYIESTPQLAMNQQWLFQKQQIAQQLIDQVGFDRVIIQEIIDGAGMGMGMPGMMGGGAGDVDIEEALEDVDVDADEILEEIDADTDEDIDADEEMEIEENTAE